MADHDPRCPHTVPWPPHIRCDVCDRLRAARADERVQVGRVWAKREDLRDAHAEAVAARLVEVICRMERTRQIHVAAIHGLSTQADVLEAERDAARAEVAALREWHPQSAVGALRMMRAEQTLADLRAKVEGLPVFVTDMHNGTGPHYYEHTVLLAAVLALIEEAAR